ncbi:MAG: HAD family hydrolase [Alphaproteobacteria bacterium]
MSDAERHPNARQPDLWVVLDLGGVLFEFHGFTGLAKITGQSEDLVRQQIVSSPTVERLETGQISPEEFADALVNELALDLDASEFLHLWTNWEAGEKPGTADLLDSLSSQFNLACLSNTSAVHWPRLLELRRIGNWFDRLYASHEIGHWKPNRAIFDHVEQDLGVPATQIVYFDDNQHIVDAARDCGWDAHQATSPEAVEAGLHGLGLLPYEPRAAVRSPDATKERPND